jgi:hypothetical protein
MCRQWLDASKPVLTWGEHDKYPTSSITGGDGVIISAPTNDIQMNGINGFYLDWRNPIVFVCHGQTLVLPASCARHVTAPFSIDPIDGPPCMIICEKFVCSIDRNESMPSAFIMRMGANLLNEAADIAACANSGVMQQMLLWGELLVCHSFH